MSSRHLDFCDLHIFRIGQFSTLSFVTFVCIFHLGALIICMVLTSACCASPRRWNPIYWSGGSILSRSPPLSFSSSLHVQIGSVQSQVSLPTPVPDLLVCQVLSFLLFGPFLLYLFLAPFFTNTHGHHFGPILFEFGPFRFGRAKPVMLI